ncbi:MAG: nucleotidyltransferase family protein [Clostridiales bacterium]|nr:nucleotidyltransferase family protein [Clostridiales bacterium]
MRTVGIVAEYNPFHTGHEYHIRKAKALTGAAYAVVVMSPDFVQRGEPAIFDKYTRAGMALNCGADLVIELPVCYATGSAEHFAEGGVRMLDSLGVVDALCFGVESGNAALFQNAAEVLLEEPDTYRMALRDGLKKGLTFPQARASALPAIPEIGSECARLLSTPNNTLGVEYCKALLKCDSKIMPVPIDRIGSGYSSQSLDGTFCSATALRRAIHTAYNESRISIQSQITRSLICEKKKESPETVREKIENELIKPEESLCGKLSWYIPKKCEDLFWYACKTPVFPDDLLPLLYQKLICCEDFENILDLTPDLTDRIRARRFDCIGKSFDEIVTLLKTKQMTESRIRRVLLHLILGIQGETAETARSQGTVFYAHLLGFRTDAAPLLHEIKKRSILPLISKTTHASDLLSGNELQMWEQDIAVSHLYRSLLAHQYKIPFRSEYEISPIRI